MCEDSLLVYDRISKFACELLLFLYRSVCIVCERFGCCCFFFHFVLTLISFRASAILRCKQSEPRKIVLHYFSFELFSVLAVCERERTYEHGIYLHRVAS